MPAVFSHTEQIHQAVRDFMFNQIKLKLELADSQVQSSKIQSTFRFWVTQLACVVNRRSTLAGVALLVDSANVMLLKRNSYCMYIYSTNYLEE